MRRRRRPTRAGGTCSATTSSPASAPTGSPVSRLGNPRPCAAGRPSPAGSRRLREAIAARIAAVVPDDRGAICTVLLTGAHRRHPGDGPGGVPRFGAGAPAGDRRVAYRHRHGPDLRAHPPAARGVGACCGFRELARIGADFLSFANMLIRGRIPVGVSYHELAGPCVGRLSRARWPARYDGVGAMAQRVRPYGKAGADNAAAHDAMGCRLPGALRTATGRPAGVHGQV